MNKTPISWLRGHWNAVVVIIITLAFVFLRVTAYEDPRLSIGAEDSKSYFACSQIPLNTTEFFTSRRPFTYPLFMKALTPAQGAQLTAISNPAMEKESARLKQIQPGFEAIPVGQMIASIIGWCALALSLASVLRNPLLRIVGVILVLAFAFTPQMVDWDSVLMSESLSFSLFAILIALTIRAVFRIRHEGSIIAWPTRLVLTIWCVVLFFWVFVRDTNAYALLAILGWLIVLLLIPSIRRRIPVISLLIVMAFLVGTFFLHDLTYQTSNRFGLSFMNIYGAYIKKSPQSVAFFRQNGMPETDILPWAKENGTKVYFSFLIQHPGFVFYTFYDRSGDIFGENLQPFFYLRPRGLRGRLITLGNMLHPQSNTVLLSAVLLNVFAICAGLRQRSRTPWIIILIWLFSIETILMGISFFGDSFGIVRHTMGAVVPLRLSLWLLPLILTDFALEKESLINLPG